MSLRLRVVVAIAMVFLFGAVVGTALAGWQAKQVLREELIAALAGGRQTVSDAFDASPRSAQPGRDLGRLVASFNGNRHVVASWVGGHGERLGDSTPLPTSVSPSWFAALFHPDVPVVRMAAPGPSGAVVILEPVFANDVAGIWSEFIDLVGVLSISFGVGAVVVWFTVGRALRPLSDFSAAFLRIGSGDYSARVREAGPLELIRLGRGVNDMVERLSVMQAKTHALEDQLRNLQDEERADLARDLHDEIGPHLFAANVDAAMARRLIGEGRGAEAAAQVGSIEAALAHIQRLVRDILGRLRPTELFELGLAAAINELVAFWRARNPTIRFAVKVPPEEGLHIPDAVRETLYRVVQESLNNAVRHGRPSRVEIEIGAEAGGGVFARITDDGAPGDKPQGAGFGLIGMRERVTAARGSLTIARDPTGWSVQARLPRDEPIEDVEEADAA